MAQDETSVLDREMFRSKSRDAEELNGPGESEDVTARRMQAHALIEAAKEKFDPKNFQTLSEQERPQVFRPVAINMPAQQQTLNTAQRMQQMSAMGVPPIGMARGGLTDDFYSSPYERSYDLAMHSPIKGLADNRDYVLPSYDPETMAPTLSSEEDLLSDEEKANVARIREEMRARDELDPESFDARMANVRAKLRRVRAMNVKTPNEDQSVEENKYSGLDLNDPKLWTDEQIDEVAKRFPGNEEGTAAGLRSERQMALDTADKPMPVPIIKRSRETLRPERGILDLNLGNELERRQREFTEKAIEKRAGANLPKVISSGQYVRPDYPRTLTQEENAVRKAAEEGVSVVTPGMSVTSPSATSSEDDGIAALVGSGRGAVERPGERLAYLRSRAEGNLPSGESVPPEVKKAVTAATGGGKEHPTSLSDIKRERDDSLNLALLHAGLAIMAGRSPNALTNIGEGGIAGLQSYIYQRAQGRARDLEERKLNMLEKYYGSREKALSAADTRHQDALMRMRLDALKAAQKDVADAIKEDPTLARDRKRLELIREEATQRYMGMFSSLSDAVASSPELNAEAPSLLE